MADLSSLYQPPPSAVPPSRNPDGSINWRGLYDAAAADLSGARDAFIRAFQKAAGTRDDYTLGEGDTDAGARGEVRGPSAMALAGVGMTGAAPGGVLAAPRGGVTLGAGPVRPGFTPSAAPPQKSVTAYKLFRTNEDTPGALYPLFVDAKTPVQMGTWLDASAGPMIQGKVKSELGPLAFRPGWHAGDLPIATHIGKKTDPSLKAPNYRPDNQTWAEISMPADVDWQAEALARAVRNARGEIILRTAHITDQIPVGGFYRYKTNPNMTGNWLIGGSMRVNRILPDEEVRAINSAAGTADLPRLYELFAPKIAPK